jgi:hypothetical protein
MQHRFPNNGRLTSVLRIAVADVVACALLARERVQAGDRGTQEVLTTGNSGLIACDCFDYRRGILRNADQENGWKGSWKTSRIAMPSIVKSAQASLTN